MPAQILDFEIEQGSTFKWDIHVLDPDDPTAAFDLTDYDVRSMARSSYASANAAFTFTCTIVTAAEGHLRLALSAVETAAIAKGNYVYDVEVESDTGEVAKLYKGRITVTPEATK